MCEKLVLQRLTTSLILDKEGNLRHLYLELVFTPRGRGGPAGKNSREQIAPTWPPSDDGLDKVHSRRRLEFEATPQQLFIGSLP